MIEGGLKKDKTVYYTKIYQAMNLKFIHSALLLLSVCCFYSCKYELEEENYIDTKQLAEPDFNIILKTSTIEDGVILVNYEYLRYEFTVAGALVENLNDYTISVYLDGREYYYSNYYYSCIRLDNYSLTSGYHNLKMIVRRPVSTGSLASDLGVEYLEKAFEWRIKIDFKDTQIVINHRKTNDGKTEFYWEKPDPNYGTFKRFRVYHNNNYSWNSFYTTETSYVFSQGHNYYDMEITAEFEEPFLNEWYGQLYFYNDEY